MNKKLQFLTLFLLMVLGGANVAWAQDASVTFSNGITWERAHGILTFDNTNKVITGTTSNWSAIGVKTIDGTNIALEKNRLTWLVITGTNLNKGTNNPCVFNLNGDLGDNKIKYVDSKSSTTKIVIDITKRLPEPDGSGNVVLTSLGFYLDDPNGTAGDHAITENQPTITNIEFVYPETDSPIAPTNELLFRTNDDNSAWNSGFPKEANGTNQNYEINYVNGFYALQKYTIENLAAVKSLTLHLYGDPSQGHDAMAVWAFTSNDWSTFSDASDLTSAVASVVGIAPHATEGDANTPLVNGTNDRYTADNVQHCLFVISEDKLEALKGVATDNTFTLLITNRTGDLKANNKRMYYSSGQAIVPFRPYMEVAYIPAFIGEVGYETLNAAFDAISTEGTIDLYDDITITSRCNVGAKSITVNPVRDGLNITSTINNGLWILSGTSGGNLTIGSDAHQLTIGGADVVANSGNMVESSNSSVTTLNNVRFKNLSSGNNTGIVVQKSGGKLNVNNCVFEDCTAPSGRGVLFCGNPDGVVLSGDNRFINCSDYDFYLERRFRIDGTKGVTNTTPIRIFAQENNIGLNNPVATQANEDDVARFFVMNPSYALFKADGSGRRDLKVCEGKTLEVSSAGAATFVLPFDATIPEDVECYTVNYTSGDKVAAAPVSITLPANTPVLVNAAKGVYKFRNASKATTATSYETSATPTVGALVGVYTDTYCPADDYILGVKDEVVAFYKPNGENTNYVRANHAYLHADGAGVKVMIDFDKTPTGINGLTPSLSTRGEEIFNLAGQRMSKLQRGVNIVNGKKVLVK